MKRIFSIAAAVLCLLAPTLGRAQIDPVARGLAANATTNISRAQTALAGPSPAIGGELGDSRVQLGHNLNLGVQSKVEIGLQYHLEMQTRGRVAFPMEYNFAVGGATSCDLLNSTYTQLNAAGKTLVSGQLAAYPNLTPVQAIVQAAQAGQIQFILYPFATTNDRTSGFTVGTYNSGSNTETIACIYRTLQALRAANVPIIGWTETARGDSAHTSVRLTSQQLAYHLRVSRFFRAWRLPGIYIVDSMDAFADPASSTGDARLSYTADGLHQSYWGAYYIAQQMAPVLNTLFPAAGADILPSIADIYSATDNPSGNLLVNGRFQTTTTLSLGGGGTSAGTMPASWLMSGSSNTTGLTVTGSQAACTLFPGPAVNGFQMVVTGTSGGSTPKIELRQLLTLANYTLGDVIRMKGWIEIDSATGVNGLFGDIFIFNAANNAIYSTTATVGNAYEVNSGASYTGSSVLNVAHGGYVRTDTLVMPDTSTVGTSSKARFVMELAPSTAINATVRVCAAALEKQVVRPTF